MFFFLCLMGFSSSHHLIGAKVIEAGELIRAKFDMQRIKTKVKTEADVDRAKITFVTNISHCHCLNPEAYISFIQKVQDQYLFDGSVYFHPNFRVDGWEDFRAMHEAVREEFGEAQRKFQRLVDMRKEKAKKGKKKETKEEREKWLNERKKFDQSFPGFPDAPVFWEHTEYGSDEFSWPPRLFFPWMEDAKKGKDLCLDPALPKGFSGKRSDPVPAPTRFAPSAEPEDHSSSPDSSQHDNPDPVLSIASMSLNAAGPSRGPLFEATFGHDGAQCQLPDDDVGRKLISDKSSDEYDNFGLDDDVLAGVELDGI
jgi:hypothetical protein